MTTVFVMGIIPDVQALGETLDWVFLVLFPNHCMGRSFMVIYTNYLNTDFCVNTVQYETSCLIRQTPCCKDYGRRLMSKWPKYSLPLNDQNARNVKTVRFFMGRDTKLKATF